MKTDWGKISTIISIIVAILVAIGWYSDRQATKAVMKTTIEHNTEAIKDNTRALEKNQDLWLKQMIINGKNNRDEDTP